MLSKITIESAFQSNQIFIAVNERPDSSDMRDQAVSAFRHRLSGLSSQHPTYCRVTFPDEYKEGGFYWYIHPMGEDDMDKVREEIGITDALAIDKMNSMCTESLAPDLFEQWEKIKQSLYANRKNLKQ